MRKLINRLRTKYSSILKNTKGFSNLELAIGTLILITIICAITDFSKTTAADSSVSSLANYVVETISEQGGLNTSTPANYPGTYTTSKALLDHITASMNSIGIPRDRWVLRIKGPHDSDWIEVQATTNTGTFAYKSSIAISLAYQSSFDLLNQNLPSSLPNLNREIHRRALTTYHDRASGNIGFD